MEAAGKKGNASSFVARTWLSDISARYFVREGEAGKIIEEQEIDVSLMCFPGCATLTPVQLTYGAFARILRGKFGFKTVTGIAAEDAALPIVW